MPFNLIAYGLIALAVMGMIGTGVYKVKQWGYNEAKQECIEAALKQRKVEEVKVEKAATNRETDRAKIETVYKTITERVETYIDRPVYRNVCFDTDGLRDANAALSGTSPDIPKSISGVPGLNPTP